MSLCPFKWLVSTFLRQCGQSFKRLIARIPRQWGLRLALGGMSGAIASRAARSISRMVEGGWSLAFAFGVDCLIEQPTPVAELSTTLFHLGYDRWLGPFAKKSDENKLFLGSVSIKLYEDRLKMFELRRPVLYFLLLALKVALNPTTDGIHNRPGVSLTNPKIKPMGNSYSYMQKNT